MPAPAETPEAVPVTDHTLSQRMVQQSPLEKYEREIIRYIVRYGYRNLFELPDGSWQKVWEYIVEELSIDNIELCNPLYKHIVELTAEQREYEAQQVAALRTELQVKEQKLVDEAIEQIRLESGDIADFLNGNRAAQRRIGFHVMQHLGKALNARGR